MNHTCSIYQSSLAFLKESKPPAEKPVLFIDSVKFKKALSSLPNFSEYRPSEYGGWYHPETKKYIPAIYQEHDRSGEAFLKKITGAKYPNFDKEWNPYRILFWLGFVRFYHDGGLAGIQGYRKPMLEFVGKFIERLGKLKTEFSIDVVAPGNTVDSYKTLLNKDVKFGLMAYNGYKDGFFILPRELDKVLDFK